MMQAVGAVVDDVAAARPLLIRRVRPEGPYDVRFRLDWMGPENAEAPDPDVHYDGASFADILAMDPRGGLLILDPSYYCNLACSFCALPIHRRTQIDWGRIASMLRILAKCGMRRAVITGGEPGILPGLTDIVGDLRAFGFERVVLFTHATWAINQVHLDRILASGITDVTMSIKAFDDVTAQTITRKRSVFTKQRVALRALGEALADGRLRRLRINHVITTDTLDGMLNTDWLSVVPPGAGIEFCVVEPYEPHMVAQVPAAREVLDGLFMIFAECRRRGIDFKIDGVPLCLLGDYRAESGDPDWLGDEKLRVFIKPGEQGDYFLAHHGYQRILQYGYRDSCAGCSATDACIGVHKRYEAERWTLQPLATA